MDCKSVQDGLSAYLDGEAAEAEGRGIEDHLAACPACREALEACRRVDALYADLPAAAAPADFEARVREAIDGGAKVVRFRPRRPMVRRIWPLAAAAALLLVVATPIFWLRSPAPNRIRMSRATPPAAESAPMARPEMPEAQVRKGAALDAVAAHEDRPAVPELVEEAAPPPAEAEQLEALGYLNDGAASARGARGGSLAAKGLGDDADQAVAADSAARSRRAERAAPPLLAEPASPKVPQDARDAAIAKRVEPARAPAPAPSPPPPLPSPPEAPALPSEILDSAEESYDNVRVAGRVAETPPLRAGRAMKSEGMAAAPRPKARAVETLRAGRVFHEKDGVWVEAGYAGEAVTVLQRNTARYAELLREHAWIAEVEDLGPKVVFRIEDRWCRIETERDAAS